MANVFNLGFLEDERRRELGLYNPEEEYVLPEDLEDMEPVRLPDAPSAPEKDAGAASAVENPATPAATGADAATASAASANPVMESAAGTSPAAKEAAGAGTPQNGTMAKAAAPAASAAAASSGAPRLVEPSSDLGEEGPALYWPESGTPHRSRRSYSAEEYYAMPRCGITELVHGKLCYMPLPDRRHQQLLSALHYAIARAVHEQKLKAAVYAAPFAVDLFPAKGDTIVHPDLSIIFMEENTGENAKRKLDARGLQGAPDWVIEIVSPGNPVHDYYEKLMLYWKAGIREYWILNPMHENLIVYSMGKEGENFDLRAYHFEDKIQPSLLEGACIDLAEITSEMSA